jgi:hypothetical protein
MNSDNLRILAKFCTQHKWPGRADIANWGADTIDLLAHRDEIMVAQIAEAQSAATQQAAAIEQLQADKAQLAQQVTQQAEAITKLEAWSADLQTKLAAATISPLSLVLIDTHLHGFATATEAAAFVAANPSPDTMKVDATDFTWHAP